MRHCKPVRPFWIIALIAIIVYAVAVLSFCRIRESPRIQVAPTATPQIYTYILMNISRNVPNVGKGAVTLSGCAAPNAIAAKYIYTYGLPNPHCGGIEWTPMLPSAGNIGQTLEPAEWLLLFNEPDRADQANITPADAVPLLRRVEELYTDYKLVSPAPSHLNPAWLETTRNLYYNTYGAYPRWDAIALHCYFADRPGADYCKSMITMYAAKAHDWDARLWLTEFACVPDILGVDCVALESEFIDWLKTGIVDRYYRFISRWDKSLEQHGACPGCERFSLTNIDDTPNQFGRMYQTK